MVIYESVENGGKYVKLSEVTIIDTLHKVTSQGVAYAALDKPHIIFVRVKSDFMDRFRPTEERHHVKGAGDGSKAGEDF